MVADFGLARDIYESGMYETTSGVSTNFDEVFCCPWRLPERSVNGAMNTDCPLPSNLILGLGLLCCAILLQLVPCSGFRSSDFHY